MSIVYKIRRADGMFSMGGSDPKFNKTGKIWKQRGHLTSHLTCVADHGWKGSKPYDDCQVVTYELTETAVGAISIKGYLMERAAKKAQEGVDRKIRQEERRKTARHNEYLKLCKEFGSD